MKIALGCDHGGYDLMQIVKKHLDELGIEYQDFGTYSKDSCHYPVFGRAAAEAVASGACDKGIVICTTGIGISITANKVHGIRAALCCNELTAEFCRRHNDANVLAMGAKIVEPELAVKMVDIFLNTAFEGGRHATRVGMMMEIEQENEKK